MVVLDSKGKRVRVQRIDISKSLKKNQDDDDAEKEEEEEEDLDSNDDSDYEGGDESESEDDDSYVSDKGSDEDYSDEDFSDGESKKKKSKKSKSTKNSSNNSSKKKSDKPVPPKSSKNKKKDGNDDDDFNLPKKVKLTKQERERESKESKEIYEETLKQANLDQWITKKSSSTIKSPTQTDPNRLFSFSKPKVSSTVAATSTSPSTTATTAAPIRLATIKKPLGGGSSSSDRSDFFSKFLYNGKSKLDDSDNGNGNGSISKSTNKAESEKEEEEDNLFTKGFGQSQMKNIKKSVNKMISQTLSDGEKTDNEQEEEEEAPLVNKKRKSTLSSPSAAAKKVIEITDDGDNQEVLDSDSTEDEKEKPSKSTKKSTKKDSSDNEMIEINDEEEEEEEQVERDIDEEPTIEKLIYACEFFSKRMLEILSNSDLEENNTTSDTSSSSSSSSSKETTTTTTTSTTSTKSTSTKSTSTKSTSNQTKNKLITQPKIINKTMRNYQLIGLNWMALLYRENINGILADEMGLGKTVQTISLLAHIMETYNDCGPHLIIVPATVMSNWGRELEQWCPTLKVIRYYGNLKEREELRYNIRRMKAKKDYNIILTTYNLLFSNLDRAFLKKFDYSYLILDEAQNIKNSDSRRYKNIFKIESKHRLLLTGTPLQNNLFELWSLLNFLMPHIFGSTSKNNDLLNSLLEFKGDDSDSAISRMKKILSPFILRRLKSTVSKELKPKRDVVEKCIMPEFQQKTYNTIIERSKAQWANRELLKEKEKEKEDTKKRKKKSSNSMVDPDLVDLTIDDDVDKDGDSNLTGNQKEMVKQLKNGSQVLNNILMQLRKAANHPLLCKNIFYNEEQIDDIVKTLAKNDKEWKEYRNDIPELKEVFQGYSDYEVFKLICENPLLADKYWIDDEQFYETSAKCLKLKEILAKEIHENKSKVLIFSQMTRVLDILEDVLSIFGEQFTRLDGSTPVNERQDIIDHFTNSKDIPIFLLSTMAGGLGINLTCANVVIFYDLSFNPQVDRQAEDRAHRLGQEREVIVYKLLTEGTVDIDIFNSANQKKKLNDNVLEEGSFNEKETKLESKKILKILDTIFTN